MMSDSNIGCVAVTKDHKLMGLAIHAVSEPDSGRQEKVDGQVSKRVKDFIKGNFSKRFVTHYYFLIVSGTIVTFYVVSVLYYGNYIFPYDDISFLGDSNLNPHGWFYWNIGTALTGLLLIPLQPYFFRRLRRLHAKLGLLASSFLIMSTVGMIGIGAIPENNRNETIHELNATLAFVGLYFGVFFGGIVILRYGRLRLHHSLLFIICGLSGPAGFLITQVLFHISPFGAIFTGPTGKYPWYLTFSTWEWMLFLSVFADLIIFMLILPDLSHPVGARKPEGLRKK